MPTSRRKSAERELRTISLHSPEYSGDSDLRLVKDSLAGFFPTLRITVKPTVLGRLRGSALNRVAEALARSRVKDPTVALQTFEPMLGEIDFEKRAVGGEAKVGGVVYDGQRLREVVVRNTNAAQSIEEAVIVFTQRLVSTYSRDDLRHHLRTLVCGFPSIVSIPGVVEAPAKPREYYVLRQELLASGHGEQVLERLKANMRERFIDYDDPRNQEVLKGLALQAIMFHLTLEPFCSKRNCVLFNAHWQEDLIASQLGGSRLCRRHEAMVGKLGKKPILSW